MAWNSVLYSHKECSSVLYSHGVCFFINSYVPPFTHRSQTTSQSRKISVSWFYSWETDTQKQHATSQAHPGGKELKQRMKPRSHEFQSRITYRRYQLLLYSCYTFLRTRSYWQGSERVVKGYHCPHMSSLHYSAQVHLRFCPLLSIKGAGY